MTWNKIGRNERCPRGSGKKYKRFCGQNDEWAFDRKEVLRGELLEMVNNQLHDGDPPETKQTYDRLRVQGYADVEIMHQLGSALLCEISIVTRYQTPFDRKRYASYLNKLPDPPWSEES